MVLITAHLDSTAARTTPYSPATDPAPGADDDASGIAGVLAAARAIKKLSAAKRPKRTIRFVLFNAEEVGLVGSGEYARDQRALLGGGGIGAVYQMDMIGYNREPPVTYEIYAGSDPGLAVQDKAFVLAERIGKLSEQVSPNLPAPQIYLNRGVEEDKELLYHRSDHYSFNLVEYPACLTIEDYSAEFNPEYHSRSDTSIDPEYAADIARAVAAAAWVTANL
jgi:Zn-dependent M28 family amino/carboxypeptidase